MNQILVIKYHLFQNKMGDVRKKYHNHGVHPSQGTENKNKKVFTLSAQQTKTIIYANCVDPNETARNSWSTLLVICIFFFKLLFAPMGISNSKTEELTSET